MERQQTVLIADDEAQIREILSLYFKKEGFKVIEAADGAEALVQIQAGKPDIILLDIMMPVLDGFEVCKQVRKISDVPIIMLTAKDFDDDRILGLEMGPMITSQSHSIPAKLSPALRLSCVAAASSCNPRTSKSLNIPIS